MDWHDLAWWQEEVDGIPRLSYTPSQLQEMYGECSSRAWGSRRNRCGELHGKHHFPNLATGRPPANRVDVKPVVTSDLDHCRRLLLQPRTMTQLADLLDCSPKRAAEMVDRLESNHLIVERQGDEIAMGSIDVHSQPPLRIDSSQFVETEWPIGWVSDTHLCSKYARMDVLEDLYDRYQAAGVKDVYLGGNWIDGEARFNKFDICVYGCGEQVAYFVEHFPRREGITTHILSGDDHEGWYVQREHLNIGELLEDVARRAGRTDLTDLGYMERDIIFEQPHGSATMRIIHAGGGSSYAVSYTSQKYVEQLTGGEKPKIVLVGHFHKFDWCDPREVDVIQMMTTQDQTPFMRKKRLRADVGGGILWIRQNELGIITGTKLEKFHYYNREYYKYHWKKPTTA